MNSSQLEIKILKNWKAVLPEEAITIYFFLSSDKTGCGLI